MNRINELRRKERPLSCGPGSAAYHDPEAGIGLSKEEREELDALEEDAAEARADAAEARAECIDF